MELRSSGLHCSFFAVAALLCSSVVFAGDIVHHDDTAPKRPGCENNFVLVKILSFLIFILLPFFFCHLSYSALSFPVCVNFFCYLLRIVSCGLLFLHSFVWVD